LAGFVFVAGIGRDSRANRGFLFIQFYRARVFFDWTLDLRVDCCNQLSTQLAKFFWIGFFLNLLGNILPRFGTRDVEIEHPQANSP
jgi:hypothetical protein